VPTPQHGIRSATVDNAIEIAEVHVESWRAAYRGLLPQALLDGLSVERRAAGWRREVESPGRLVQVATDDAGRIVGFVHTGASRDDDADRTVGELMSIYLRPEHWDRGIGNRLHAAGVAALAPSFRSATLWVLERNRRTRAFHERQGWQFDGTVKRDTLGDVEVLEVRYRRSLLA